MRLHAAALLLALPAAAAACTDALAPIEARLQECAAFDVRQPGTLELRAKCSPRAKILGEYERALELARASPADFACRTATLNEQLCAHAAKFLGRVNASLETVAMSGTWARYMKELSLRETVRGDCASFHEFHQRHWHPWVFRWADGVSKPRWRDSAKAMRRHEWDALPPSSGATVEARHVQNGFGGRKPVMFLPADPLFTKRYAKAVEPLHYGPPDRHPYAYPVPQENGTSDDRTIFRGRFFHASHIALLGLMLGTPRPLRAFRQIVEFGSGSGELADMAPALGFKGLFVIYDLPQMLLMQRYWLRLAARPAYLMEYEAAPRTLRKLDAAPRIALVSSLHTAAGAGELWLPKTLSGPDGTGERLVDTLFLGFWSFTEAAPAARVAIMPLLQQFGTIQISFNGQIQGWDNIAFLAEKVARPLLPTHTVCVWDPFTLPQGRRSRKGGWLIATHRERGERAQVRCVAAAGCTNQTLIPFIPSNCVEG